MSEHKVCDVVNAAVLVDEYVLTQKTVFVDRPFCYGNKPFVGLNDNGKDRVKSLAWVSQGGIGSGPLEGDKAGKEDLKEKDNIMCFYCKKMGHIVASCPVLRKRNVKSVALVNKLDESLDQPVGCDEMTSDLADFAPFMMDGVVSLAGTVLSFR